MHHKNFATIPESAFQIHGNPPILPPMPDPELTSSAREARDVALKRIAECARRRVTVLDLSGLALTSLPDEIVQLTKLTELDVSSNRFASLPPHIGQLDQLVRLDLSHNQLASLPAELGRLTQLLSLCRHSSANSRVCRASTCRIICYHPCRRSSAISRA